MADSSRAGRGPNGIISRRTAEHHAGTLLGALHYTNNKVEKEVRDQVYIWIRYDLTQELGLNKSLGISKPVAHRADVSLVLRALFSPLGLRQVLCMRTVLNLAIFINLLVDSCARIHEITATERYKNIYLRWRDLKVYVFQIGGVVSIRATLKVGNLKGKKDRPDEYKIIPLSLLPPALCFEDSLRLLLHAAIIDDHIKGVSHWSELEALCSQCHSDTGLQLVFRESSLDLPLIPHIDHVENVVVKTSPASPDTIPRHLVRLGRLCGFEDIFKRQVLPQWLEESVPSIRVVF